MVNDYSVLNKHIGVDSGVNVFFLNEFFLQDFLGIFFDVTDHIFSVHFGNILQTTFLVGILVNLFQTINDFLDIYFGAFEKNNQSLKDVGQEIVKVLILLDLFVAHHHVHQIGNVI